MKNRLTILAASVLLTVSSLPAANIAWVSFHPADSTPSANATTAGFTNAPDAGYTKLLAANGHTVNRFVTIDSAQNNPDLMAAINTNNLVIISRSVPSGHYDSDAERTNWHTSVTVPLISMGGYINRNNRLGFHTGDTIPDVNSAQMRLRVNAPAHPIFAGIALDATNTMVNPYSQRVYFTNEVTGVATNYQAGISVVTSPVISGGTILATVGTGGDAAFGGMVIGEFPPGINSSRTNQMAARRLVFLSGSREANGLTSEGSGIFDLLPDGQTLFLNAVTYLTTPQAPKCTLSPVGATNLVAGDAWTLTAGPIGDAPLTYQWYKNGQPLSTGTNPALTFTSLLTSDAGEYYLIVTNPVGSATSTVAQLIFLPPSYSITNSLVSYWPLDTVLGTKTPDLVSGYDMTLTKMGTTNLTTGKYGNAFQFDNAWQSLLERSHNPGEALPIYQHPNFTVSLWVFGLPQSDHRVFSECNLTNNNTMFDLGTHNAGTDGTVDIYIRTDSGAVPSDHRHSTAVAFDGGFWHNIVYVQRDVGAGIMKAQLWVDGALDPVAISPGRPLSPNTTAIGGVRRASASAWYTGLIDEVAVWNRALSEQEIGILQVTSITNPPSRLQPLAINSFKADLPAVVSGGSTTLRWDVSKDATQVTITPLGDVTALTSVGVGSRSITNTQAATYELTIKRGTDMLSATTSVAVVEGVAAGWALLDNFDTYAAGNLFGYGYWSDPSGNSAQVLLLNDNPAIRTTTGGSIAYLNLQGLSVAEDQARTLFFRVVAGSDTAVGITNIVGLTDKSQRSYADEFQNVGPVLYPTPFTNDVAAVTTNAWYLGARNGYLGNNTSNPIDYPGPPTTTVTPLIAGAVYNVWIDITNAPSLSPNWFSDTFTVYVQKEGDPIRTVLFQDYTSDRDPYYVDAVLGGLTPVLDKLVVVGNNANYSAVFDDFYLSTSGYNATVPRAYGNTGRQPAKLSIDWVGTQLRIQFGSGTLQQSTDLTNWADVDGNPPSPYLVTPTGTTLFFRTR